MPAAVELSTSDDRLPPATTLSVRVGRIVSRTEAEGPGARFALWVQGCSIRCPGCFNPQFFATRGGTVMSVHDLVNAVPTSGIEGVTLLGGEPFEQAPALASFARVMRERGLSVMSFSGATLDELQARARQGEPGVGELLAQTDLLVDGPFLQDDVDHKRPWVGSRNQGVRALTDRYRALELAGWPIADRLEVRIAADGTTAVNGWAGAADLDNLLVGLRTGPRPSSSGFAV